jgi:hypothetical protein
MAMILFRKLLPKDDIMLLNCVEVHSSAGAEPLVSDLGVVSTLFTTHPHLSIILGCFPPATICRHSSNLSCAISETVRRKA